MIIRSSPLYICLALILCGCGEHNLTDQLPTDTKNCGFEIPAIEDTCRVGFRVRGRIIADVNSKKCCAVGQHDVEMGLYNTVPFGQQQQMDIVMGDGVNITWIRMVLAGNSETLYFRKAGQDFQVNSPFSLEEEISFVHSGKSHNWGNAFLPALTSPTNTDGVAQIFVSPVSDNTGIKGIYFEVGLKDRE